jgi:hypothetical protein
MQRLQDRMELEAGSAAILTKAAHNHLCPAAG